MTMLPSTEHKVHQALLHSAPEVPLQVSEKTGPPTCRGNLRAAALVMTSIMLMVVK
jgi:hypothetical protein